MIQENKSVELTNCSDIPANQNQYRAYKAQRQRQIKELWKQSRIPDRPRGLISPEVWQGYADSTWRKAIQKSGKLVLFKPNLLPEVSQPGTHIDIYRNIEEKLNHPAYAALRGRVNRISIRGPGDQMALIVEKSNFSAISVRKSKQLAEQIQRGFPQVKAAMITRSKTGYQKGDLFQKQLFDQGTWQIRMGKKSIRYPWKDTPPFPVATFESWWTRAVELLNPSQKKRLVLISSQNSLFRHLLAGDYAQLVQPQKNGRLPMADRVQEQIFVALPHKGFSRRPILDLCERQPERVLRMYHSIHAFKKELSDWRSGGYMLAKAVPVDYMPCTDKFLLLVEMIPDKIRQPRSA